MVNLPKPNWLKDITYLKLKSYMTALRDTCTHCNGTGVEKFDEENKTVYRCKFCTTKFANVRKYLEINLSPRHVEFTTEKVEDTFEEKCFDAFKVLVQNSVKIITSGHVFLSQRLQSTSYGVNTLGTILLKELVDRDIDCWCVTAQEISDCFFNFSDDKERNERLTKLLDYYEGVQVLMITDFADQFKSKTSSFALEKFMDFLLKRRLNNRFCIFCSAVHWDKIIELYGKVGLHQHITSNGIKFDVVTKADKSRECFTEKLAKDNPELSKLTEFLKPKNGPPQTIQESPQEPKPVSVTKEPIRITKEPRKAKKPYGFDH